MEMAGLFNFISQYGDVLTATAAWIALLQPWGVAAWKRFFRSGHIDIYETGTIEIGYSGFGPTIGLSGTLRASHHDIFIRRIRLTLVKDKDHSQHSFEWCIFRSQKITLGTSGKGEEIAVELPYSFMVMHTQPHRYNILFNDQARLEEIRPTMTSVRQAWYSHRFSGSRISEDPQTAYTSFHPSQAHVSAFTNFNNFFYWEPCAYSLRMVVETENDKSFLVSNF